MDYLTENAKWTIENVQPKPWVNPLEKSNFRPYKMKLL